MDNDLVILESVKVMREGGPAFRVRLGEPVYNAAGERRGVVPAGEVHMTYAEYRAHFKTATGIDLPEDGSTYGEKENAGLLCGACAMLAPPAPATDPLTSTTGIL
ncbi:MAG: hypothetical protein KY468_04735 [Armatimonadetes bacterium]|nr:hypothetical protein [Armatimonadota bacterium]